MPAAGRGRTQRQTPIETPKVEIPRHRGRSAIKAEERRRNIENAKTPFVPPAPTSSSSTRPGGRARVSGGIQIGVPQSSPISTQRPNRSSSTTTETPTKNPERVTQATGGVPVPAFSYYDQARKANPDGGTRNFGEGYKEAELEAGQKAENYRAGAGFRGQTRVSPTDVVQTGTSTGPKSMTMEDANSLLSDGYTMRDPFSSTQLPVSRQSPYANVGPIADGAEYARNLEMQKPGAVTGVGPIADGESYAQNVEAGEQLAVKPTDTATNWGARTAADNSDAKLARRRAFFSGESSMQGLRNMESQMGISYAGGQHRMVNPNATPDGKNDFITVDNKDDIRGYKSGRLSAQDMKDKYVTKIKDNGITSYDEDKVSDTAGPLADADAYSPTLQNFRDNGNSGGPSQMDPIINQDPGGNQKPLTVDLNDMPSDMSGAAGQEYLKKLDAGLLTRR